MSLTLDSLEELISHMETLEKQESENQFDENLIKTTQEEARLVFRQYPQVLDLIGESSTTSSLFKRMQTCVRGMGKLFEEDRGKLTTLKQRCKALGDLLLGLETRSDEQFTRNLPAITEKIDQFIQLGILDPGQLGILDPGIEVEELKFGIVNSLIARSKFFEAAMLATTISSKDPQRHNFKVHQIVIDLINRGATNAAVIATMTMIVLPNSSYNEKEYVLSLIIDKYIQLNNLSGLKEFLQFIVEKGADPNHGVLWGGSRLLERFPEAMALFVYNGADLDALENDPQWEIRPNLNKNQLMQIAKKAALDIRY